MAISSSIWGWREIAMWKLDYIFAEYKVADIGYNSMLFRNCILCIWRSRCRRNMLKYFPLANRTKRVCLSIVGIELEQICPDSSNSLFDLRYIFKKSQTRDKVVITLKVIQTNWMRWCLHCPENQPQSFHRTYICLPVKITKMLIGYCMNWLMKSRLNVYLPVYLFVVWSRLWLKLSVLGRSWAIVSLWIWVKSHQNTSLNHIGWAGRLIRTKSHGH